MKRKIYRFILSIIGLLLIGILLGVSYLQLQTYPAEKQASHVMTQAENTSSYTFFQGQEDQKTIIIYPGALVESASYAFLAQRLQETGYNVYLISSPLHLPVLDSQAALKIMEEKKIPSRKVVLVGHSLGGVVAAQNAEDILSRGDQLAGLVLLASYPADSTDLSQSDLPVLSITADQDKIIKMDRYSESKNRLPQKTDYQVIKGGNHSGFGLYGQQKGDGQATISNLEQQDEIVKRMREFLG